MKIKIENVGRFSQRIEIDGKLLENCVGVRLESRGGDIPHLHLEMLALDGVEVETEALVTTERIQVK